MIECADIDLHENYANHRIYIHSDSKAALMTQKLLLITTLDNSLNPLAVFCDLSKAFDSVNHDILLHKLELYGFRGRTLDLIKSYLKDRSQIVEIKKIKSLPKPITCGVPQGSILGPLLFIIFINDVGDSMPLNCNTLLYADDTSFVFQGTTSDEVGHNANKCLSVASNWFKTNQLLLNPTKTVAMNFALKKVNNINIIMDSNKVQVVNAAKFLGITIDQKLNWSPHIERLSKELCSAIYAIRKIKFLAGEQAAMSTYYACIHSKMAYGILTWGNAPDSHRIFILQKQGLRTIFGLKRDDHCAPIFKNKKILTFQSEFIYQCIIYAKANLKNEEKHSSLHEHNTRNKNNVVIPKGRRLNFSAHCQQKLKYFKRLHLRNA